MAQDERKPTVFTVHGWMGTPITHSMMASSIRKAGFDVQHLTYSSMRLTLDEIVEHVANDMESRLKDSGSRDVILIGHSLGGVVCRQLCSEAETRGINVKGLVAIAAPLHGNSVAALAHYCGVSRFLGPVLQDLGSRTFHTPPDVPYRTLSAAWPLTNVDGRVHRDATTITKEHHRHFRNSGHSLMLFDPRVVNHVRSVVAEFAASAEASG